MTEETELLKQVLAELKEMNRNMREVVNQIYSSRFEHYE